MTPHPQPEYIITEEDIRCLYDYFQAALDGEENKETLKRLFGMQCGVIRSNIYNPQYQCGDECKGECSGEVDGVVHCPYQADPCKEQGCDDIENCDEICKHRREIRKNLQSEQEKVLEEFILITKYEYRLLEWVFGKLDEGRFSDALGEIITGVGQRGELRQSKDGEP